jgi:transcriptional regulator with XRE-family HTH domain
MGKVPDHTSAAPAKPRRRPETKDKFMASEKLPECVEREHHSSPIDVHVGSRVRLRRTSLGVTQEKLGRGLNLTFQQVQKYERGANRIGASRLFDLARLLDVPVGYFFDDMPDSMRDPTSCSRLPSRLGSQEGLGDDPLQRPETLELVRAYSRITEPAVRKRLLGLIKSLAFSE